MTSNVRRNVEATFLVVSLFVLTFVGTGCDLPEGPANLDVRDIQFGNSTGFNVGDVAPEIAGPDTAGKRMQLSEFRGNVVLLVFWGHW